MEAGLLSIVAGKEPAPLVASHAGEGKGNDLLADSDAGAAFRALMQQAQSGQSQGALAQGLQQPEGENTRLELDALNDLDATLAIFAALFEGGEVTLSEQLQTGQFLPDGVADALSSEGVIELAPHTMYLLWQQAAQPALQGEGAVALSAAGEGALELTLNDEALEAVADWLHQLKQMYEEVLSQDAIAADMTSIAGLPQTVLPAAVWSDDAQALKLQQQVSPLPASPDAAASAPDIGQLSDAELAKLDALIDRIAQQGAGRDSALAQFGNALEEQLAEIRLGAQQTPQHDTAQLSSLSASHASQQTNAQQDAQPARLLHAAHLLPGENAAPSQQVRVSISHALQNGLDRVQVQLDPADLGRVEVRLDVAADGRVQVAVQADNRDTLDLLQRDARLLEKALQEAGIDASMQDMAFNLGQGGDEQAGDGDAPAQTAALTDEAVMQGDDALASSYTLSIAQGLDIKV